MLMSATSRRAGRTGAGHIAAPPNTAKAAVLQTVVADLAAETDSLVTILARLATADWDTPTPAEGWTIRDQVTHLAFFDDATLLAVNDPAAFAARLARRKTGIKRALLDQSLISGIGNIYADEALWRARLHWARPTETLRKAEVSRLLEAVDDVLTEALKAGGTSFDAQYVNVNGESGYFDISLNAYGREGEPCARCGAPIRRDAFMNRSAYSCPRCQPRPRNGHW